MKAKFNINKEIGLNIKKYRKKTDYSQDDMASLLGMSRPNYCNLENGRNGLLPIHIYNICRILPCTPTRLFPLIEEGTIVEKVIKLPPKKRTKTTFTLI